ncbi:Rv3654c family TadE-like protein [Micromonospora sp. NPDC020750]|uniref:Rv3654c family TadE-like protein n=1 Tax=unclassified Micromonospora TaxID=2617518 RepID=UPI0037B96E05
MTVCARGTGAARRDGERGGATVCLLAVGLVFVVVGLFGAAVGAARVARQQARVAADFGALAGAGRALAGDPVACASADEVVRANGARLAGCRLDGLDAVVTAEVTVSPVPGLTRVATVTSRAGPVRD